MIPATEALENARNNKVSRWNGGDGSAKDRMDEHLIVPEAEQTFKAKPKDVFFAIGSCFARNVEERLELAGATVSSRNIEVRDLGNKSAREGGIFNKYTPTSILQEMKWAAGIEKFPEDAFLPAGGASFYDPFLSAKAGAGSTTELLERREEIGAYFRQAFEADVVIVTLGLIECWIDKETGLMLNEAPSPRIIAAAPDRFAFECLSVKQSRQALAETMQILRKHSKKKQKRIVTVSPVPLGRTFTRDDIIVANASSKATLRVAAKGYASTTKGLDYFPSYESVMHSNPNLSWQSDRRHVSDVVVGNIISVFLERYGITKKAQKAADVEAMKSDALFQALSERSETPEELLARLNAEVNKYKNMVIKLQADLRKVSAEAD